MTIATIDRRGRARRPPKRFAVAVGAVVAGLVLAGCGGDDDAAAFTEDDALVAVEAYYAAAAAGDADAVAATFADDPVFAGVEDPDEQLTFLVWDAAQGTELVDRSCRADGEAQPAGFLVVCEYGNHQYLHRVVGAPATPMTETITVTADGIAEMDASYHDPLFPAADAFDRWMRDNHGRDARAADCCGGGGTIDDARSDGETRRRYADLWAAYLDETGCGYDEAGC
jgi:hypothetical protein